MKKLGLSLILLSFVVMMMSGIGFAVEEGLIVQWAFDGELPEEVESYGDFKFVDGKIGESLQFDGATTYLEVDENVNFNPENITIAFWYKASSISEGEWVFVWAKEDTDYGGNGWYLNSWEGGDEEAPPSLIFVPDDMNYFELDEPSVLQQREIFFGPGEWIHIAVTFDYETQEGKIYRNGQEMNVYMSEEETKISNVNSPAWIGFNSPGFDAGYIHGAMDDFRLYDRALSKEEIQQIMDIE